MGNSNTSRPDARTASASASGKAPPPHTIATGPASAARVFGGRFFANSVVLAPAAGMRRDQRPPLAFTHEGHDPHHVLIAGELLCDLVQPCNELPRLREQHVIGASQAADRVVGEPATAQTNYVEAGKVCSVAFGGRKWDHVAPNARQAAHNSMRTDTHALVRGGATAHEYVVFDDRMTADHDRIREDHVVADPAVVGHVRVGHEHAAVADPRFHTAAGGAAVHGDALADDTVGADHEHARLALVVHRLRWGAEGGERPRHGARSDAG